jgi:hypothetical protein
VTDSVRVGLDRFVLDPLGGEAFEECVEPGDGESDPARARLRRVRLDEKRGMLVDLPEDLVPDAPVRGSPEESRIPIDAGDEIGYRDRRRGRLSRSAYTSFDSDALDSRPPQTRAR